MSSNLIEQPLPAVGDINIVLATGCPDSGWEIVIPVLRECGLKPADQQVSAIYDEFDRNGIPPPDSVRTAKFPLEEGQPLLLTDQRNFQILDFWAAQQPHARFLLFYQNAETALAHALLQGNDDPLKFLHDWQTTNRQLINFQRRHRDRAILLNAEAATRHTQGLLDACARIQLKLESSGQIDILHPAIPATERLLADYLVKQHPAIPPFQAELEARAQPFDIIVQDKEQQIAALIDDYLREITVTKEHQQRLVKTTEKLQATEQASNQQRTVIQQLTEELQKLKDERNTLSAEKQTLQKNIEQNQNIQNLHNELEKENELLLLQLHQVQEELEDYYLKYQELVQKQPTTAPAALSVETPEKPSESRTTVKFDTKQPLLARLTTFFKQLDAEKIVKQQRKLILNSGLFDETWYLAEYPDVAKAKADPVFHYLRHGARARRNPSPHFNTGYYLQSNPDVAESGMNPLFHYIKFGQKEGRKPA